MSSLKKQDKKALLGSEFVIWFFRFLLIILVITVIVFAISLFYSKQHDVRQVEASILAKKITECLIQESIVKQSDFNAVFEKCSPKIDEENYYINMTLKTDTEKSISFGSSNLEVLCQIKKSRMQYPVSCLKQRYFVIFDDGKELKQASLNMLIAISKIEKNV